MSRVRRVFAVLCSSAMLAGVAASPAAAQGGGGGNQQQNGLVNVGVNTGDCGVLSCNQTNVGVGVAANILANVCGVAVNAAVLAVQGVDQSGEQFSCTNDATGQTVTITQDNRGRGNGPPA
jgi:bifunctional ADP-heptose synthase (sugar kinase/adenylyltransferase)